MSKLKPMLLLPLCMSLVACAGLPQKALKPSQTPSVAPTANLVPTISCGQHEPDGALPDYPMPSADMGTYLTAQAEWATKAAGLFQQEKVLRHNTATCLNALEAKGLIHQGN